MFTSKGMSVGNSGLFLLFFSNESYMIQYKYMQF